MIEFSISNDIINLKKFKNEPLLLLELKEELKKSGVNINDLSWWCG